jgi:hypothetical protein
MKAMIGVTKMMTITSPPRLPQEVVNNQTGLHKLRQHSAMVRIPLRKEQYSPTEVSPTLPLLRETVDNLSIEATTDAPSRPKHPRLVSKVVFRLLKIVLFQSLGMISSNRIKNPRQGLFMASRLSRSRHRRDHNQGISSLKHARPQKTMPNIIEIL